MVHVGTLWGFSAIQKEVLAINDEPMVCPVLPVMVTWDHRLIDGVKASQLILRFASIIQDPQPSSGQPLKTSVSATVLAGPSLTHSRLCFEALQRLPF